jgi:hypothetical protein
MHISLPRKCIWPTGRSGESLPQQRRAAKQLLSRIAPERKGSQFVPSRRIWLDSRGLTLAANHFSSVLDREALGNRNDPSFCIVGLDVGEPFTEADRASEFRFAWHWFRYGQLFGLSNRACDQVEAGDPGRVPAFENFSADFALETVDFARACHGFGAPIDRAAFAESMSVL